jgi:predicted DNA-binding protein
MCYIGAKRKMNKDSSITLRISDKLKQSLQKMAQDDRRTLSSYIGVVLERHMEAHLASLPLSASPAALDNAQRRKHTRKRRAVRFLDRHTRKN